MFVGSDNNKLCNLSVPLGIAVGNKRLQSSWSADSQGSGSRRKIVRARFWNFCGQAPPRLANKRLAAAAVASTGLWTTSGFLSRSAASRICLHQTDVCRRVCLTSPNWCMQNGTIVFSLQLLRVEFRFGSLFLWSWLIASRVRSCAAVKCIVRSYSDPNKKMKF